MLDFDRKLSELFGLLWALSLRSILFCAMGYPALFIYSSARDGELAPAWATGCVIGVIAAVATLAFVLEARVLAAMGGVLIVLVMLFGTLQLLGS